MHVFTYACVQGVHMMFQGSSQDLWTVSASARGSVLRALMQHSKSNRQYESGALLLFHCAKERHRGLGFRGLGFMPYVSVALLVFLLLCAMDPVRERATQCFGM